MKRLAIKCVGGVLMEEVTAYFVEAASELLYYRKEIILLCLLHTQQYCPTMVDTENPSICLS